MRHHAAVAVSGIAFLVFLVVSFIRIGEFDDAQEELERLRNTPR